MPHFQRKSFSSPDQVRRFPSGDIEIVRLGEIAIGRLVLQPGWRWSKDVAPVVGTRSCQLRHVGYAISGSLQVTLDDGTELVIRGGDGYEIPPGHDVLVLGTETWEGVEFASAHAFGLSPEELGERVLATVLFATWSARPRCSSGSATTRGRTCSRSTTRRIRAAIDRFGGREVASTGDGFLALFDGAAKAVRAAALMDPAVAELGIRVRVGLHTSEVEIVGGQPRGVGVHAAARVAALAGPGEVLVSGTTRDLLEGSGLVLERRGERDLKGLSGSRAIFALQR